MTSFKFKDKSSTAVFTVKQIYLKEKPILFVNHNLDGTWHFFTGDKIKSGDAMMVALFEISAIDKSIDYILDLPKGWQASRKSIKEDWLRVQVG